MHPLEPPWGAWFRRRYEASSLPGSCRSRRTDVFALFGVFTLAGIVALPFLDHGRCAPVLQRA